MMSRPGKKPSNQTAELPQSNETKLLTCEEENNIKLSTEISFENEESNKSQHENNETVPLNITKHENVCISNDSKVSVFNKEEKKKKHLKKSHCFRDFRSLVFECVAFLVCAFALAICGNIATTYIYFNDVVNESYPPFNESFNTTSETEVANQHLGDEQKADNVPGNELVTRKPKVLSNFTQIVVASTTPSIQVMKTLIFSLIINNTTVILLNQ